MEDTQDISRKEGGENQVNKGEGKRQMKWLLTVLAKKMQHLRGGVADNTPAAVA